MMKKIFPFLCLISSLLGRDIPLIREELVRNLSAFASVESSVAEYNQELREELRELFLTAVRNKGLPLNVRWALYAFGSTGQQIALPDSDLEFGLLISENRPEIQKALQQVVEEFKRLVENGGIYFDKRGWHPLLPDQKVPIENKIFIATPQELAFVRNQRGRTVLRYALYHVQYLAGDEALMEELEHWKKTTRADFRDMIHEERLKTTSTIHRTIQLAHQIDKNPNVSFTVKQRWIKPALELIQYLCIQQRIEAANPYEALDCLEERGIISMEFKADLIDFLNFTLRMRGLYGNDIKGQNLSDEEVRHLIKSTRVLTSLTYIQK